MTTATLKLNLKAATFPEINWKMTCIIGFLICLPLLVLYVWQINDLTSGSYLMNSYSSQMSKLSQEGRNLEVSFAENSFLGQALAMSQALNFQKVTSVTYMQIPDSSVAMVKK